jgi:hypothetical protein
MIESNDIVFLVYLPLAMLVLSIMIYIHRHIALKYLYIFNFFCFFVTTLSYMIMRKLPVGKGFPEPWMEALPFIWIFGFIIGLGSSVLSLTYFVLELAKHYVWAKVIVVVCKVVFSLLLVYSLYFVFMVGIPSLKSG